MNITVTLNGTVRTAEVRPDTTLFDFLREQGCYSVKCGCETSNCGLCTVHLDGHPVLSLIHIYCEIVPMALFDLYGISFLVHRQYQENDLIQAMVRHFTGKD